jgi:hypothetical protein
MPPSTIRSGPVKRATALFQRSVSFVGFVITSGDRNTAPSPAKPLCARFLLPVGS